jgi:hypothetical protein
MKRNLKQYIPFGFALLLTSQYLLKVLLTSETINIKGETVSVSFLDSILFGAIGLLITLVFILLKKKVWKVVFTIVIVASFTPWIQFWDYTFAFGISPISLDLIGLALLISHLTFNSEILKPILEKFKPAEKDLENQEKVKALHFENRIKDFERKFMKKTNNELQQIVEKKELIPEALEAAERILRTK